MGTMAAKKSGVTILIMMIMPKIEVMFWHRVPTYCTIIESRISMSFVKRFKIRPKGVVSKNVIGAFRTLASSFSCSTLQAIYVPYATPVLPINVPTTVKKQKPIKV